MSCIFSFGQDFDLVSSEMSSKTETGGGGGQGQAEGRLSIHEVPEQISRIFFGEPNPRYAYSYVDKAYGEFEEKILMFKKKLLLKRNSTGHLA